MKMGAELWGSIFFLENEPHKQRRLPYESGRGVPSLGERVQSLLFVGGLNDGDF